MKFEFQIKDAAGNNVPAAKLRESIKMASLAYCLCELGHDVSITNAPSLCTENDRWKSFRHLHGGAGGNILVIPAEKVFGHVRDKSSGRLLVGIKTSVGCKRDEKMLESCDVLVAQENNPIFNGHPNLLSVPFIIHDVQIRCLQSIGLLDAYLNDDLQVIRDFFFQSERSPIACFCGFLEAGDRSNHARMIPKDLCEIKWTNTKQDLAFQEYFTWMSKFAAGIVLPGYTSKSNRWSEVVLLGLAVVCTELSVPITPPATASNTIMLKSWDDRETLIDGLNRTGEIVAEADTAYREGWSPMGQMKQLVKMLEAK